VNLFEKAWKWGMGNAAKMNPAPYALKKIATEKAAHGDAKSAALLNQGAHAIHESIANAKAGEVLGNMAKFAGVAAATAATLGVAGAVTGAVAGGAALAAKGAASLTASESVNAPATPEASARAQVAAPPPEPPTFLDWIETALFGP